MNDYHKAAKARWDLGFAGMLLAGIMCSGCSDSSTIAGLLDANNAESTASAGQTTAALSSMALEASLFQIEPANFAPLSGPPGVTPTGDPTSGTVTVDFGAGTVVNNATVSGTMVATYLVTGGTSVSITVTFSGLTANTSAGGAATIAGSLTLTGTLTGNSNITGTFAGSVTATTSGNTTTVTPNLTYAINGAPTTGDITLDGTVGLDSSIYGDWIATLTAINGTVSQSTREITSGIVALDRSGFLPVTATMTFTGANSGTLVVSPSGFTRNFDL